MSSHLLDGLVGGLPVADAVGPLVAALALQRAGTPVDDGDRKARARLEDPAEPPAAQQAVRQRAPVVTDRPSLADRQLVARREDEVVPHVEERRPVIAVRVVRVLPVGALRGRAGGAVVAEVVAVRLAQGVRRHELEAVHVAPADARLQRVVVGVGARGRDGNRRDERLRLVQRPPRVLGCPGGRIADARQRLVALDRGDEVVGAIPHVAHLRRHRARQLVLDEGVELLRELRPDVRVPRPHVAGRRQPGFQVREPARRGAGAGRAVVVDVGLEEVRRVHRQAQVRARAFQELRDAVPAAGHQAVRDLPGRPDARLPAVVERLVERAGLEAAVLREDLLPGHQVEVRLAVVLFHQRRRVGPAQPEVQGEGLGDLEVVLREQPDAVLQLRPRVVRVAAPTALARRQVEQEVGERVPREGAVVVDEAEHAVVAGVEPLLDVVEPLAAELHRVAPLQPGQLLVELERGAERVGVDGGTARRGQAAAPADGTQPLDGLAPRDAVRRVAVADAGPVVDAAGPCRTGVPDERLVDDGRSEDAVPVEPDVPEGLVVERAHQERNRRLRVLVPVDLPGEAPEDLVVLRRVPVDPDIALLRPILRQRLADVVAGDACHCGVRQRVLGSVAEDGARHGADAVGRDDVARELLPGERVDDRRGDARQVADAPRRRRDRRRGGARGILARSLVVAEEEQRVLHQRPAEGAAIDVLPAFRLRRAGPVPLPRVRVEVAVPVELERVAPEAVGARLQYAGDDGAAHVARVGGVVVGLDRDLGHGIRAGLVPDAVVDGLVHVETVQRVVVHLLPVPVDVGARAADARDVREAGRVGRHRAGQHQGELAGVPAVERQRRRGAPRDHLADRGRLRLQDRGLSGHLDGLGDGTDRHLEVETGHLPRLERDGLGRGRPEPGQFGLEDVGADEDRGDGVVAGLIGDRHVGHVGGPVGCRDGDARQGAARLVDDEAGDGRGAGLGVGGDRHDRQEQRPRHNGAPETSEQHTGPSYLPRNTGEDAGARQPRARGGRRSSRDGTCAAWTRGALTPSRSRERRTQTAGLYPGTPRR